MELRYAVIEFTALVGSYYNVCVAPASDRLPQEIHSRLTEQDKSKLNGFLSRYELFINDYQQFLRELAEARPSLSQLPGYLASPNPLS